MQAHTKEMGQHCLYKEKQITTLDILEYQVQYTMMTQA